MLVEEFLAGVEHGSAARQPGRVHHAVQLPEGLDRHRYRCRGLGDVGEVDREELGLDLPVTQLTDDSRTALRLAAGDRDGSGAGRAGSERDGRSHPAGTAADENDLVLEKPTRIPIAGPGRGSDVGG